MAVKVMAAKMSENQIVTPRSLASRRGFLQTAGAVAAGSLVLPRSAIAAARRRVLRIAHLTDIHIQPELRAPDGFRACLNHMEALPDKPQLILTGGDHVMDCYRQPRERTRAQWDLFASVLKQESSIPVKSCIGNHDIWGWNKTKSETTGNEPEFGKNWASQVLAIPHPYYSFDQAGWHFIALDSVRPGARDEVFAAFLDEEQFAWLEKDLASVPPTTPVLIWSHIPIVSALPPTMNAGQSPLADMSIECGHIHSDGARILELLTKHPNVKACLSGHLHRIDHVEVKGVHFHCNGAVCGKWWRGGNDGFPEGYTVVDLYDDGSYQLSYVTYGWEVIPA